MGDEETPRTTSVTTLSGALEDSGQEWESPRVTRTVETEVDGG